MPLVLGSYVPSIFGLQQVVKDDAWPLEEKTNIVGHKDELKVEVDDEKVGKLVATIYFKGLAFVISDFLSSSDRVVRILKFHSRARAVGLELQLGLAVESKDFTGEQLDSKKVGLVSI